MNASEASQATRIKVGIFTVAALFLVGITTVVVNDQPYWWRACQLVHINVEDATGLKAKSSVRSLGLEIGYLKTVILSETHVDLGICITERVEVLSTTRAYIRSEGFLGDKFVELKPVKYIGPGAESSNGGAQKSQSRWIDRLIPSADAAEVVKVQTSPTPSPAAAGVQPKSNANANANSNVKDQFDKKATRQIPVGEGTQDVQQLMKRVDSLVGEMTSLTNHLRDAISPEDLRSTMKQLNRTLENASRTLSPEGGLNQTAQRTLAKLEDAIDQMRDLATRVNQGQGSLGMLLNDPSYAEEIREVIKNANRLLSKVSGVRFNVDVGAEKIAGYDTSRGWFRLGIWPAKDRYYLLGISIDPRGRVTTLNTTTTVTGGPTTAIQTTQVEPTGILLTGMLGKVFYDRLDLSLGAIHGDGAVSIGAFLGPQSDVEKYEIRGDIYTRTSGGQTPIDGRLIATARVFMGAYFRVGLESFRTINGVIPFSYGAGVSFNDDDIKLLFALR